MPHTRRADQFERFPLHVTLRVLPDVPSLRAQSSFEVVKRALKLANERGLHRAEFRITHYSVQGNHLHIVAEASDADRLSRGMQGLAVRIARRLNNALGRRGPLFSERFYARALVTGREVRNVLAYVLLNERRHLAAGRGLTLPPWYFDPCSSAAEFDGWRRQRGLARPPPPRRDVTVTPRSQLLRSLWREHGLISPDEVPGRHAKTPARH